MMRPIGVWNAVRRYEIEKRLSSVPVAQRYGLRGNIATRRYK